MPLTTASTRRLPLAASILLALTLAACSTAPVRTPAPVALPAVQFAPLGPEHPDVLVGRLAQWSQPLADGARVLIDNPHGNVYVRHNRGGDRVGISGHIQRLGKDPLIERLDLRADPHSVLLTVRYPDDGRAHPRSGYDRPGRVDLTVLVPASSHLTIRTTDGEVSGKRLRAPLDVETTSGSITFLTHGSVRARSDSGDIRVVMAEPQWQPGLDIASTSGAIFVEWRASSDVRLEAHGGKDIQSDVAAILQRLRGDRGAWSLEWAPGGASQSAIAVHSGSGPIHLSVYGTRAEFAEAEARNAAAQP